MYEIFISLPGLNFVESLGILFLKSNIPTTDVIVFLEYMGKLYTQTASTRDQVCKICGTKVLLPMHEILFKVMKI